MDINYFEKMIKAFANKRRIAILKYLEKHKKATVGEMAEKIKLSFRSTSKHLILLIAAEVVARKQVGKYVFYEINEKNKIAEKLLKIIQT